MNTENIVFWLRGFLEGKETLTIEEIKRIKAMIDCPDKPTMEQVDKMYKKLFPDLRPKTSAVSSSFINE